MRSRSRRDGSVEIDRRPRFHSTAASYAGPAARRRGDNPAPNEGEVDMVALGALWLPILVSAVVVFIATSIVWMLLPHHRSDWAQLPGEAGVLDAMRKAGVGRGQYRFPWCDPRDKSPETVKKLEQGPMGTMIVWP